MRGGRKVVLGSIEALNVIQHQEKALKHYSIREAGWSFLNYYSR